MNNREQHHAFITTTDRKSLYTQLKNLVVQAQEGAHEELVQRRNALKLVLEKEDKIYEEEFGNKVKSRIDEDIRKRKENLLKIKEESIKNELEFLKSKRIQQYMNSCYEIREKLRQKETLYVRECHLKQMLEKEQALKREKEFEKYWLNVQNINLKLIEKNQAQEDCLKNALVQQVKDTRKVQLEELREKRERDAYDKLQEKNKLNTLLEELRLEAFDRNMNKKISQKAEYRDDLLKMINEKKLKQAKEYQEQSELHQQLMCDIAREKAEETLAIKEKKKSLNKATMDFIKHTEGVRQFEKQQQQMFNNRIDELRKIDMCTKSNILLERQRKARVAQQCYTELRQQICEQHESRLKEEAHHKENKMLENRFIHKEISRAEILAQKHKVREELDKQIDEVKQIRETEAATFPKNVQRASNDPDLCDELVEKYIKEGIDYLAPHPSWNMSSCGSREYVTKAAAQNKAVPKPCAKIEHKIARDGSGDQKTT